MAVADPILNPYTPNAGAQPPAVLGRDAQLNTFDVSLRRMTAGRTEQSMIITGLRGVGKTVLHGRFRKKAHELGWLVVEREVSKHDDDQFRRQIVSSIRTSLFEMSPKARLGQPYPEGCGCTEIIQHVGGPHRNTHRRD